MNTTLEIIVRTFIAFILIMIIAKILGKQILTQMSYYDFVSSITLGAITANLAFNTIANPGQITVSLVTFSGIVYIVTLLTLKSRKIRKWLSGKPTIVIESGKILDYNLKKIKLSMDTLIHELREKDIFNIEEVDFAVLELNGKISVLKKPEYQQVTKKDLLNLNSLSSKKTDFPIELILDGKIVSENMKHNGISQEWLSKQLNDRGLTVNEVFYAVKGTNGGLYFDVYKDKIKHPIDPAQKLP
jgi:uncharacterized membrane protein YcaP (DUF421 family)